MMKNSQSYFITDGEWKFTNLSISEYREGLDDEEYPVIVYKVPQYIYITLHQYKK